MLALLIAGPAASWGQELYRWTDAEGQVHWVDDPTRIPAPYRRNAVPGGFPEPEIAPAPVPAAPSPTSVAPVPPSPEAAPRRYSIPIEKAGLEIYVPATLNGRTTVPLKVDTGAMVNTIPRSIAEDLDLPLGPTARTIGVVGVSGERMVVPVVRLRSVEVGGAVVENVDAAVLDTMAVGLLGMPFFRHFRVEVDPSRGRLNLEEIDLDSVPGLYGGYPEGYWRRSFRTVQAELDQIDEIRARLPGEYSDLHRRLDDSEAKVRAEYERLELEASRAGVPTAWRE